MRFALIIGGVLLAASVSGWSDTDKPEEKNSSPPRSSQIWKTRPVRRDTPLREENISDQEVLELEAVLRERYPGSVVYISAVTTGCPCEDGPRCTDQVWSVASRNAVSRELAISKIDGKWQIGPLQEWWLVRDRIRDLYTRSRDEPDNSQRIDVMEYLRRITEHDKAFPTCDVSPNTNDT